MWAEHRAEANEARRYVTTYNKKQTKKSNARDTTNFTTKCLQTDMTSYVEVTHQQLMIY